MSRDALDELVSDLQIQAGQIVPFDADERESWLQACHQVLAAMPDPQRKFEAATNLAITWAWHTDSTSSLALRLLYERYNGKEERG